MSKRRSRTELSNTLIWIALLVGVLAIARWYTALTTHLGIIGILLGALGLGMVGWRIRRAHQRRAQQRALLDVHNLQGLSGVAFEEFLQVVFQQLGYHATLTKASGDFGADLLLKKQGRLTVVQAKRYQESVGIAAIQQVLGAKAYYHADAMLVVTNADYTKAARTQAQVSGVTLWSRNELAQAIQRAKRGASSTCADANGVLEK